jgi:hypothetical protein
LHIFGKILFRMSGKQGYDFLHNYTIRLHFLQIYTLVANHLPYFSLSQHQGIWEVMFLPQKWISCFPQLCSDFLISFLKLVTLQHLYL